MSKAVRIDLIIHRLFDRGIEFRVAGRTVIRMDRTGPVLMETEDDAPSVWHAAARLAHLVLQPGEHVSQVYLRRKVTRWD